MHVEKLHIGANRHAGTTKTQPCLLWIVGLSNLGRCLCLSLDLTFACAHDARQRSHVHTNGSARLTRVNAYLYAVRPLPALPKRLDAESNIVLLLFSESIAVTHHHCPPFSSGLRGVWMRLGCDWQSMQHAGMHAPLVNESVRFFCAPCEMRGRQG
ncbi:hypothetical protein F4803DRAFT_79526 [Xylaria telfairii]|nr:hypothetical protein F4803DRAFT_79526 [Xylaria telfairii]